MGRPRALDLFCGGGGMSPGLQLGGFYVTGVVVAPQPNYVGDEFYRADALTFPLEGFDVVCASPPCQARSDLQKQSKIEYPELVPPTRERLLTWGGPYVIENVEGPTDDPDAQLRDPIMLCGVMFPKLRVIRHRLFESNVPLTAPPHGRHPLVFTHDKRKAHYGRMDQNTSFVMVNGGGNCTVANKRAAMGVPWMTGAEANEAIPPAYGEFVGRQLMEALTRG